ncbi:hypothetical protein [Pseudomonas sp. fls2-241-R2A-110]|uniref:hypothetical protein n=1 Tax=Pseudomonas sp. fls2-241-R2A-110 TaxID=3040311 RepID=UPI0025550513|nr:hypothetical protein [Pseudomonas sp. fls2-241-R2A-110]
MEKPLLIDNPYYQALAALVAELGAMEVDLDEAVRRAVSGLEAGKLYAVKGEGRAEKGAEVLEETVSAFRFNQTA